MSSRSTGARMDDNGTSAKKQQSMLDSAHEDMRQLTAMLHMECSETVLSLARPGDGKKCLLLMTRVSFHSLLAIDCSVLPLLFFPPAIMLHAH